MFKNRSSSRFILNGHWYQVIKDEAENLGRSYKSEFSESLNRIAEALKCSHSSYSQYCQQLQSLLDKSPWECSYIKDIINSKDLITFQGK